MYVFMVTDIDHPGDISGNRLNHVAPHIPDLLHLPLCARTSIAHITYAREGVEVKRGEGNDTEEKEWKEGGKVKDLFLLPSFLISPSFSFPPSRSHIYHILSQETYPHG